VTALTGFLKIIAMNFWGGVLKGYLIQGSIMIPSCCPVRGIILVEKGTSKPHLALLRA
jgi:hypothetical protein